MKLTQKDKEYLRSIGETEEEDINQIERAISKTKFEYHGERISTKTAIGILGREIFLSGMQRSAFHLSAVRYADWADWNGEDGVYFYSSEYFKK